MAHNPDMGRSIPGGFLPALCYLSEPSPLPRAGQSGGVLL